LRVDLGALRRQRPCQALAALGDACTRAFGHSACTRAALFGDVRGLRACRRHVVARRNFGGEHLLQRGLDIVLGKGDRAFDHDADLTTPPTRAAIGCGMQRA
jgi:hypothetical protein